MRGLFYDSLWGSQFDQPKILHLIIYIEGGASEEERRDKYEQIYQDLRASHAVAIDALGPLHYSYRVHFSIFRHGALPAALEVVKNEKWFDDAQKNYAIAHGTYAKIDRIFSCCAVM